MSVHPASNRPVGTALALAVFAVGCLLSVASAPGAPSVDVAVTGAVLYPVDVNNQDWDGPGGGTIDDLQALDQYLGGSNATYLGVAELLNDWFSDPDPYGWADLAVDGEWLEDLRQDLPTQSDTLEPTWSGAGWTEVPLDDATYVGVSLRDEDLVEDCPVGDVQIGPDDLRAAYDEDGDVYVDTHEQGDGLILFVRVRVSDPVE